MHAESKKKLPPNDIVVLKRGARIHRENIRRLRHVKTNLEQDIHAIIVAKAAAQSRDAFISYSKIHTRLIRRLDDTLNVIYSIEEQQRNLGRTIVAMRQGIIKPMFTDLLEKNNAKTA